MLTARGSSSSPRRATAWKTTSTLSAVPTTASPRCCARPPPSLRTSGSRSAPRPVQHASVTSWPRRVHPLPAGRRDTVQPGVRSPAVTPTIAGVVGRAPARGGAQEQTRARYPDEDGIRRARRRPSASGNATGTVGQPCSSYPRGPSCIRGSGRPRSLIWHAISVWLPSIHAATASPIDPATRSSTPSRSLLRTPWPSWMPQVPRRPSSSVSREGPNAHSCSQPNIPIACSQPYSSAHGSRRAGSAACAGGSWITHACGG